MENPRDVSARVFLQGEPADTAETFLVSAEWIVAGASVGTFVVIAASAIVALIQIRHLRQSNQIATLNEARETLESPEFIAIIRFIRAELPARLTQPEVRRALLGGWFKDVPEEYRRIAVVANFFESLGLLVKNGIIESRIVCELWSDVTVDLWEAFGPLAMQRRVVIQNPALWENFEYLAVLCEDWSRAHATGNYPRGVRRWSFPKWKELEEMPAPEDRRSK